MEMIMLIILALSAWAVLVGSWIALNRSIDRETERIRERLRKEMGL